MGTFEGSISHNMNYNIFLKAHDRENKSLHREQLTISDMNSLTFTTPTIQYKTLGELIPVTAKKRSNTRGAYASYQRESLNVSARNTQRQMT
jgi:hypothetical protein